MPTSLICQAFPVFLGALTGGVVGHFAWKRQYRATGRDTTLAAHVEVLAAEAADYRHEQAKRLETLEATVATMRRERDQIIAEREAVVSERDSLRRLLEQERQGRSREREQLRAALAAANERIERMDARIQVLEDLLRRAQAGAPETKEG